MNRFGEIPGRKATRRGRRPWAPDPHGKCNLGRRWHGVELDLPVPRGDHVPCKTWRPALLFLKQYCSHEEFLLVVAKFKV